MKIAFASALFGGLDTYVLEAGLWLARHGHTVHVIYSVSEVPPRPDRYSALQFHAAPVGNIHYYVNRLDVLHTEVASLMRTYEASRSIARVLRKIQVEQGLDLVELFEAYAFPELFRGLPYVVKMHGSEWTFRHYCEDAWYPKLLVSAEARFLRRARHIYAVSRSHAAFIAGACNIPPRRIHITRYPTDFSQYPVSDPPTQGPPFRLMTVGRLQKRKGTHTIVEAMRYVWRNEPDTHLYLYGGQDDFGKPQIDSLIPASEQQGRIHVEGFKSREVVLEAYRQSHVYAAPTRYEVSGGFHIQEAISSGRPVIASDIGPVPELVRHEETGWLVQRDDVNDLAEHILLALHNPELRESYGQAARRFSQQFEADSVMNCQLRLYERAIQVSTGLD